MWNATGVAKRKRPAPGRTGAGARPGGGRPQGGQRAARPAAGRPAGRGGAAAPEPKPFFTEGAPPFRHAVERRSAVVVVFLARLPRAVPGLLVAGLVAAGLLAPGAVGGVALLVVAALLGWLVYLSWPRVPLPGRAVRLVVLALVVAYALARLTGATR